MSAVSQWTIYNRPKDYPDGYVVREWIIEHNGAKPGEARTAPSLEAARELVPPGCVRLERSEGDDPVIVETWM